MELPTRLKIKTASNERLKIWRKELFEEIDCNKPLVDVKRELYLAVTQADKRIGKFDGYLVRHDNIDLYYHNDKMKAIEFAEDYCILKNEEISEIKILGLTSGEEPQIFDLEE
jgi:hypothetical protein